MGEEANEIRQVKVAMRRHQDRRQGSRPGARRPRVFTALGYQTAPEDQQHTEEYWAVMALLECV